MTSPPSSTSRVALVGGLVLLAVGIGLIITHLVLDAGDGEAPGWIVYAAIAASLAAAFLGSRVNRRR